MCNGVQLVTVSEVGGEGFQNVRRERSFHFHWPFGGADAFLKERASPGQGVGICWSFLVVLRHVRLGFGLPEMESADLNARGPPFDPALELICCREVLADV